MPYAAPKLCPTPGCSRLNCHEHRSRRSYDRRRGGSTERGYGIVWQRVTANVKARDPLCKICLREGRRTPTQVADHIIPLGRGGTSTMANLQGACVSCNTRKGDKIKGERGWKRSFAPS